MPHEINVTSTIYLQSIQNITTIQVSMKPSFHVFCHNLTLAKCGGEAQHFQSWGNWQFDSRPLKVGNRPLPDIRFEGAIRRWKDLDEG